MAQSVTQLNPIPVSFHGPDQPPEGALSQTVIMDFSVQPTVSSFPINLTQAQSVKRLQSVCCIYIDNSQATSTTTVSTTDTNLNIPLAPGWTGFFPIPNSKSLVFTVTNASGTDKVTLAFINVTYADQSWSSGQANTVQPFQANGGGTTYACTTTGSTGTTAFQVPNPNQYATYVIENIGGNIAYFALGGASVVAAVPAPGSGAFGSAATGIPLLPNNVAIVNSISNAYISVCDTGSAHTTITVTPGKGN